MLSLVFRRMVRGFGRRYGYDTAYVEDLGEIYPAKAWRYLLAAPFSQHHAYAPADALFAAKIHSTRMAGCGPCLRLAISMAREAKVAPDQIAALLRGDLAAMSADVRLGFRFADAVLQQSPELADLGRQVEILFGRRGLWDMSLAVAFGQFYPVLKHGLGVAAACEPVAILEKELLHAG